MLYEPGWWSSASLLRSSECLPKAHWNRCMAHSFPCFRRARSVCHIPSRSVASLLRLGVKGCVFPCSAPSLRCEWWTFQFVDWIMKFPYYSTMLCNAASPAYRWYASTMERSSPSRPFPATVSPPQRGCPFSVSAKQQTSWACIAFVAGLYAVCWHPLR